MRLSLTDIICVDMFRRASIRLLISMSLSLTLAVQAFAVGSLKSCHQKMRLTTAASMHQQDAISSHDRHGDMASVQLSGDSTQDRRSVPVKKVIASDRAACAACAGCSHAVALIPTFNIEIAPVEMSTLSFLPEYLSRVRNVANGLERPPRA